MAGTSQGVHSQTGLPGEFYCYDSMHSSHIMHGAEKSHILLNKLLLWKMRLEGDH